MTMVRIVIAFGALAELPDCQRLAAVLAGMEFQNPRKRTDFITAEQAVAVRAKAHEIKRPSIALAQAFQFELMLRQKDIIGEWVPTSEPTLSDVVVGPQKWVHGLIWSMISDLVLTKTISKSLRGRKATEGKELVFNLRSYPMVMEELELLAADRRSGPVVVNGTTGLPRRMKEFQRHWRRIARRRNPRSRPEPR